MWPYGLTPFSQAGLPENAAPGANQEGLQNSPAYNFIFNPPATTGNYPPLQFNAVTLELNDTASSLPVQMPEQSRKRPGENLDNSAQKRPRLDLPLDRLDLPLDRIQNVVQMQPFSGNHQNEQAQGVPMSEAQLKNRIQELEQQLREAELVRRVKELEQKLEEEKQQIQKISQSDKSLQPSAKVQSNANNGKYPRKTDDRIHVIERFFNANLEKKSLDCSLFKLPYPPQYAHTKPIKLPNNADWNIFCSDRQSGSEWWNKMMNKNKIIFCLDKYNFPIWIIQFEECDKTSAENVRKNFKKTVLDVYLDGLSIPSYGTNRLDCYLIIAPKPGLQSLSDEDWNIPSLESNLIEQQLSPQNSPSQNLQVKSIRPQNSIVISQQPIQTNIPQVQDFQVQNQQSPTLVSNLNQHYVSQDYQLVQSIQPQLLHSQISQQQYLQPQISQQQSSQPQVIPRSMQQQITPTNRQEQMKLAQDLFSQNQLSSARAIKDVQQQILDCQNLQKARELLSAEKQVIWDRVWNLDITFRMTRHTISTLKIRDNFSELTEQVKKLGIIQGEVDFLNWAFSINLNKEQIFGQIDGRLSDLAGEMLKMEKECTISEIKFVISCVIGQRDDEDLSEEQAVILLKTLHQASRLGAENAASLLRRLN